MIAKPINPIKAAKPGIRVPAQQVKGFQGEPDEVDEDQTVSTAQIARENKVAVTAYIAGQANYFVEGVIYSKEAIPKYKELYLAEMAKPEADRVVVTDKLDSNLEVYPATNKLAGKIDLTKEYSQTKFRSFFTEAYKEILAKNYTKVVLAEAKPEFLVVRNLLDKESVAEQEVVRTNEQLNHEAVVSNIKEGIFIIKRKNLVGYMAAVSCKWVAVLDWENNQDPEHPNGKIISSSKENSTTGTKIYDLVYIKRDMETGMSNQVKSLLELGVPYAVNTDKTENKGTLDASKVTNKKAIEDLYGTRFDYKAIGKRRDLSNKSGLDEDALKAAKAECVVQWGNKGLGKKFKECGLTEEMVKDLRNTKNRPKASTQSVDDLIEQHFNNLHEFKRNK